MGLRAFPAQPLTASPGAVYTGAFNASNFNNSINNISNSDFASLPTSIMSIGNSGASATGRPIDPESFIFNTQTVDGLGYSNTMYYDVDIPFSCPYISFQGLPATTKVYVEWVVNIEAIAAIEHNTGPLLSGFDDQEKATLSDIWPSFESMWNKVRCILPTPGRGSEGIASLDAQTLTAAIQSGSRKLLARGAKAAGHAIGSYLNNRLGTIFPNSYLGSGQGYSNQQLLR